MDTCLWIFKNISKLKKVNTVKEVLNFKTSA